MHISPRADQLRARRVPFIFITRNEPAYALHERCGDVPCLESRSSSSPCRARERAFCRSTITVDLSGRAAHNSIPLHRLHRNRPRHGASSAAARINEMAEGKALKGLRVLIAEDNLFAAMELEKVLVDLGCEPIGPVAQLDQAMRLAQQESLDGALLDIDLRGELVFAVAEELERRRIPVIFASGYDTNDMFPDRFVQHPRLRKPFGENEIRRVLEAAIGGGPALA
jgi:CheY-like chemotaxis protein